MKEEVLLIIKITFIQIFNECKLFTGKKCIKFEKALDLHSEINMNLGR